MDNNNLFEHMDHFTQIKNIYKKAIMDRTIEKYMDDSDEEIIEAVSVKANKSNRDECNATAKRTNIMVIDVETAKTGELIQIAYNIYDEEFNTIKEFDSLLNEYIGKVDFYEKYSLDQIMCEGRDPEDVFREIKIDIDCLWLNLLIKSSIALRRDINTVLLHKKIILIYL